MTAVPPAPATCLSLGGEQAARTGDAVAVISERGGRTAQVTFRELYGRADRLAHRLLLRGVRDGEPVAVLTARSEWAISSLLGVLRAGAVHFPLSTEYPPERLRALLADSGCRFVVCDAAGRYALGDADGEPYRLLHPDQPNVAGAPGGRASGPSGPLAPLRRMPGREDVAALLYTSGSTGRPKGVLIEHGSLTHLVTGLQGMLYAPLGGRTVEALSAPFVFDAALQQTLSCLANGGTLLVVDEHDRRDPHRFLDLAARHRVGQINVVAPFLGPLLDAGLGLRELPHLRHVVTGGQAVPTATVRRLLERPEGREMVLWNMYGPTETCVDSTCLRVDRTTPVPGPTLGLGTPLPGVRADVRDTRLRPLPPGEAGEICIGGTGVARGYLHPEGADAGRFVTDPVKTGGRLYRTGDLGRIASDGSLEFLGRADDQVKVRGYRVEPGEVGNTLAACPGVREAAVVAVPDPATGEMDLIAFVDAEEALSERELRDFARDHLPPWMVPAHFVHRSPLPHTINGKADRALLTDLARRRDATAGAHDCDGAGDRDGAPDPDGAAEPSVTPAAQIAGFFAAVLGAPGIGEYDNFFEAGGHSLKALQVVNRIAAYWGVTVPLRTLYEHPTATALADAVGPPAAAGGTGRRAIPKAPDQPDYPLSYAQQRLWALHQLGGAVAYNVPIVMDQGELDHAAVEQALETVVGRHESLRTSFVLCDGRPRQRIADGIRLPLRRLDVSEAPDPREAAEDIVRQEAAAPFALGTAPLGRAAVVRLGPGRCWLVLTLHHIICDGWSIVVLSRELSEAYRAARRGRKADLPTLPVRYRDFAVWDRARDVLAAKDDWHRRLGGAAPFLRLPVDTRPEADKAFIGGTCGWTLDGDVSRRLRRLAATGGRTPASVFLALFGWLLHRLTSLDDLCIGMGTAARTHPDIENLVGFFVNVLPVRLFPRPDMSFDALLEHAAAELSEALEQQDSPIDVVVRDLNPERTAGTQPLVNVMFAYQNFGDVRTEDPEKGTDPGPSSSRAPNADGMADRLLLDQSRLVTVPLDTAKFDLTLYVYDTATTFRVEFEYDGRLFPRGTVDRYLAALVRLAESVTAEVDA